MEWVSKDAIRTTHQEYHARFPRTSYWGGHAEPQLINDIEAVFNETPDKIVELLTPPVDSSEAINLAGMEVSGPYNMCDPYNEQGNNKYNCVGKMIDFMESHQNGQKSISSALRNTLKNKFEGRPKDGFVLIYNTQFPYHNVDSYRAEDDEMSYKLRFDFSKGGFLRKKKGFDDSYSFLQVGHIRT